MGRLLSTHAVMSTGRLARGCTQLAKTSLFDGAQGSTPYAGMSVDMLIQYNRISPVVSLSP
jgi:hypothetical protein